MKTKNKACAKCAAHYGDDGVCDEGKPVATPHRCIAPEERNGDLGDGRHLCGARATTARLVAGLVCQLCERHAQEIDRDFNETGDDAGEE